MCGRYVHPNDAAIERAWAIDGRSSQKLVSANTRYNVAPSSRVPVVRRDREGLKLDGLRWGLIPSWAGESETGHKMINARTETVSTNGAFRNAFRQRRCLVPALGWYEWQKLSARKKQPWFIQAEDESILAFAGIWESKRLSAVSSIETVSILTRPATSAVRHVHDRMPVLLDESGQQDWLEASPEAPDALTNLAMTESGLRLSTHRVSDRVGSPRHDDEKLIEPIEESAGIQQDLWDNS